MECWHDSVATCRLTPHWLLLCRLPCNSSVGPQHGSTAARQHGSMAAWQHGLAPEAGACVLAQWESVLVTQQYMRANRHSQVPVLRTCMTVHHSHVTIGTRTTRGTSQRPLKIVLLLFGSDVTRPCRNVCSVCPPKAVADVIARLLLVSLDIM